MKRSSRIIAIALLLCTLLGLFGCTASPLEADVKDADADKADLLSGSILLNETA